MSDILRKRKIDPSEIRQNFTNITINLHCCRYWICSEWELANLAFPFWRIYHNITPGARILFNNKMTELTNDKLIVIPPNTAFSSYLKNKEITIKKENLVGRKIENELEVLMCAERESVDHLFIHFNLGMPYDFVEPGIYEISKNQFLEDLLKTIKYNSIYGDNQHDFRSSLQIQILIMSILKLLPDHLWTQKDIDKRIINCLQFIKNNISGELTNPYLAKQVKMAANSFARLFKENTGTSVQQFVVRSRIENACLLLHHSENSIDSIAAECGFCDRYHFSKTFKQLTGMTPVYYKKHVTLQ